MKRASYEDLARLTSLNIEEVTNYADDILEPCTCEEKDKLIAVLDETILGFKTGFNRVSEENDLLIAKLGQLISAEELSSFLNLIRKPWKVEGVAEFRSDTAYDGTPYKAEKEEV